MKILLILALDNEKKRTHESRVRVRFPGLGFESSRSLAKIGLTSLFYESESRTRSTSNLWLVSHLGSLSFYTSYCQDMEIYVILLDFRKMATNAVKGRT